MFYSRPFPLHASFRVSTSASPLWTCCRAASFNAGASLYHNAKWRLERTTAVTQQWMWASKSITFTQALRACSAPQSGSLFPLNNAAHNQNTCLEGCLTLSNMEEVAWYPSFFEAGLLCGRCAAVNAGGALKPLTQLFCRTEKLQPNFFAQCFPPVSVFIFVLCPHSESFPYSVKEVTMKVNIPLLFPWCFFCCCKVAVKFLRSRKSIATLLRLCIIALVLFLRCTCRAYLKRICVCAVMDIAGFLGCLCADVMEKVKITDMKHDKTTVHTFFYNMTNYRIHTQFNLKLLKVYPSPIYGIIVEYYTCMQI